MYYFDYFYLMLHCLFASLSDVKTKAKISQDINVFAKGYHITSIIEDANNDLNYKSLRIILRKCPEYRNIFYARIGKLTHKYHLSKILEVILKPYPLLFIGIPADRIGGGLYIEHGNSTIIHAKQIGDFCWINQNVTIGDSGRGIPTIRDYVKIHTGAVVLGPITVGENSIIGANATIVKDVPADSVVVPAASYIVKRNGIRVNEKL